MYELIYAGTAGDYAEAASLFKEYAAWLNVNLCFQKFDEELQGLESMYALPHGGIILAKVERDNIGCVAVRKIDNETAELKRMYVKPGYQKHGIGRALLNEALQLAEKCGYKKIRLDTLDHMTAAINLYKLHGFYEIPAYYHNPESTAIYFEKTLNN